MTGDVQVMLWIAGVHLLGLLCVAVLLIPVLRSDDHPSSGSDGGSDDGWGNLPAEPPTPKRWPGGGLPLPDAVQSGVRLRGPGRLSDLRPRHERRPAREPQPAPRSPIRASTGSPRHR
jgi:hypothetical protein